MEAVRQVDSVTNTRDRLLQNRSSSKRKSSYYAAQRDSADLSPTAISLSREKMDIKKSTVVEEEHNLEYDLRFKDVLTKKLRAKGQVDKKKEEVSAKFEFDLKQEKTVKEVPKNKSLRFFLSYKLSEFQHTSEVPETNKNMTLYVRELVGDIEEILGKKMDSANASANQHDLKRISNQEQEKIANKLIQLINISISLAKMRKNLEEENSEEIANTNDKQKTSNKKIAKLVEFNIEVKDDNNKTLNES